MTSAVDLARIGAQRPDETRLMTERQFENDLIARLRERVAEPRRRVDERPSQFWSSVSSAGLGDLMSMVRGVSADLSRLIANGPDGTTTARANTLQQQMQTPADRQLPGPASAAELDAAERRLGVAFPKLLRRLYAEVANGGFGPGPGLVGIRGGWTTEHGKSIEDLYDEMLDATTENPAWAWPADLVPVVDLHGVYACVDCSTDAGRIVEFDFEELDDDDLSSWSRAFTERAASLAEWLGSWLTSAPAAAQASFAIGMGQGSGGIPEVTRQYWITRTPAQRATYGLPETGWGRALFGDAWGDDPRDSSAS
jgi:hypothetical protein